ncbi:MAG: hypothetical protein ABIV21_01295 [Pyrinomonadaceae bacterium]
MNEPFDWRSSDRRLFALAAVLFPLIVLIGFGRTYYLKFAFDAPPLPSLLVHLHGLIMTLWVGYFIAQVWLIRSKNARTHMKVGMLGIALAILILVIGFFTAAAAAKYGSASSPAGIPPLSFAIVPMTDLLMFGIFFGAAIYYRKRPANHKRLMLLTAINFLPPAIARIPVAAITAAGPLFFFGLPALLCIILVTYDTSQNRKFNKVFLIGSLLLIASYPLRLMASGSETWISFMTWVTTWAA